MNCCLGSNKEIPEGKDFYNYNKKFTLCTKCYQKLDGNAEIIVPASGETISKEMLPIIMVTTEGGDSMRDQAMAGGANGYVCKPFTPEIFSEALQDYVA